MTRTFRLSLARNGGVCRLCGATVGQMPIAREEKVGDGQWLMQCASCRALYLEPDMTPDGLDRFYEQEYRRVYPFESCAIPDEAFLYAIRCRESSQRRARAVSEAIRPQGRVLEVGSGYGGFLGRLHALRPDLSIAAVEPDIGNRSIAVDGAPVHFMEWSELTQGAPFDLIVLFHTLEHLTDPVAALATLAAALAENGRIVIEVPETRPEALSDADIHPAHVTAFTAATLFRTVERAGLVPCAPVAARAVLPSCLWLEAVKQGIGISPPAESPWAVAPRRRRFGGRALSALVPVEWRGRLSRWRHGPGLDQALAEPGGRIFRWGIPFDPWTMDDLMARMAQAMTQRLPFRVADVNVSKLVGLVSDPPFRIAVLTADTTTIDGMGVVWGLRLLGGQVPQRVSGVDVLDHVAALCAERGFRPYLLGAKPEVVERAARELMRRHPTLQLAGWHDGYFPREQEDEVVAAIRATAADCLVVALSSPQQDMFLARSHRASGAAVAFGVGGAFDVLAGDCRRAPRWMRSAGLEWLFRLVQEPLRLGPRYVSSNARFLVLLLSQILARRLGRH